MQRPKRTSDVIEQQLDNSSESKHHQKIEKVEIRDKVKEEKLFQYKIDQL